MTDEAVAGVLPRPRRQGKQALGRDRYSPHQNFARYDLVFLNEPKYDPAKFVIVQPNDDPQWFEKSKVASAYADTTVHIAYANSLAERQPELTAALGSGMSFDPDEISKWAFGDHRRQEARRCRGQGMGLGRASRHRRQVVRALSSAGPRPGRRN